MDYDSHSVAMSAEVEEMLIGHLLRADGQEDLAFALWNPSYGDKRLTGLLSKAILPEQNERHVHGNVSFESAYFQRVCETAAQQGYGVAFMHSHPGMGWQGLSEADYRAESGMAGAVAAMTGLPLIGLTVGSDGTWSGRFWERTAPKHYEPRWCINVRTVGQQLKVDFDNHTLPPAAFSELFKRTVTVWGEANHQKLARLRVGVVGLGSVGSVVAESLARMGMKRVTLIDFDRVERHNLDRLLGSSRSDIGKLKVDVAERQMRLASTADGLEITSIAESIVAENGYKAALDCDVLFSCVDRPRARSILNHMAYAHLIPVVDGGISVRFKDGKFSGVDWQVQTVAPDRPCLSCLGAFDWGYAKLEEDGKLDDPTYMDGLPNDHPFKQNENVFPFGLNVASLEIMQLVALVTGIVNMPYIGVQRYRYIPGIMGSDIETTCRPHCKSKELIASGDQHFTLMEKSKTS